MATQTPDKHVLSGSTDGASIEVDTTSVPGVTIHAAGSGTDVKDEVWVFWTNPSSSTPNTVLLYEGSTLVGRLKVHPNQADVTFPRGRLIQNSVTLSARVESGGSLYASGFVNRLTNDV